jgi:hypothetical protein
VAKKANILVMESPDAMERRIFSRVAPKRIRVEFKARDVVQWELYSIEHMGIREANNYYKKLRLNKWTESYRR